MKIGMRFLITALAVLSPLAILGQEANKATLTLVDEGEFNKMDVGLEVVLGNSSDVSTLTGTVEICLNIDLATNTTDQLVIVDADISGSDITLNGSSLVGRYTASSSGLKLTASTLDNLGAVNGIAPDSNPPYQNFPADQHQFVVNQGTLSGTATPNPFLGDPVDIDHDYATDPFEGTGSGNGQIFLTPTTTSNGKQFFDVAVILPISLLQTLSVDGSTLTADATLDGTLKATGTTFVDLPGYPNWAVAQSLGVDSQGEFTLSSNVPNFHLYALGFDAATAPEQVLTYTSGGVVLNTGTGNARASLELQWSTDLENWTRVPDLEMISGSSLIAEGSDLEDDVVAGLGGGPTARFYRVVHIPVP